LTVIRQLGVAALFSGMLVLLLCVFGSAKDESVEELKARVANARPEDLPELCIQIARQQLRDADKLYKEGNVEKANEAVPTSLPIPRKHATPRPRPRSI